MPDPIDREAALTAVDMDTSMVLPGGSKPGSVAWRMRDAALNALRALPAIGTCKDCAEWAPYPSAKQGRCEAFCTPVSMIHAVTPPDFFCASWRAKP